MAVVGQVVSILSLYSDNSSSNPAGYLNFRYKKKKNKEKRCLDWPILKRDKSELVPKPAVVNPMASKSLDGGN